MNLRGTNLHNSSPGNHGNQLDRTDEKMAKEVEENPFLNSLSPPARPVTNNRQYYHIPWDDSKPCLHIKFPWQDHRRRLYNANIIYKICERFVSNPLCKQYKLGDFIVSLTGSTIQ